MSEPFGDADTVRISHLIVNIARLLGSRADRSLESTGLFRGQAILLKILSEHEGLTHSEIAEKLEISPAAATKVIKRLEELNYLQRRPDPSDERISRVFLKEDAWTVIHLIQDVFQHNDQAVRAALTDREQATLIALLSKVRAHLA